MAHGGKRENAGRKKGARNVRTLQREKVFKEYQQKVLRAADVILDAQLKLSLGEIYYFLADKKKKKVEKLTSNETIFAYLCGELKNNERYAFYAITVKEPNIRAIEDILDRIFGKPTQSFDITSDSKPIPILGNARSEKI